MADAERSLSDPQVMMNNEIYQLVPNSSTLRLGKGETKVDPTSAGNNNIDIVTSDDVTTKKGYFKTAFRNTKANEAAVSSLKDLKGAITLSVSEGTFNKIMRKATIINDPDFPFNNDSNVEVELEGLPFQ